MQEFDSLSAEPAAQVLGDSDQPAAQQDLESEISRGRDPSITQRVSSFQPMVLQMLIRLSTCSLDSQAAQELNDGE